MPSQSDSNSEPRGAVLSEAVELSRLLSRSLDRLGPSRMLPASNKDEIAAKMSELDLEDALAFYVERLGSRRNAVLPVISMLPTEILRHIFLIGRLDNERDWRFPVTVSHVCRSWRDIAITTAPMWASFTVDLNGPTDLMFPSEYKTWHPAFKLLEKAPNRQAVFLRRSKGASLDISTTIDHAPASTAFFSSVLAPRIANLNLTIPHPFKHGDLVISCISAVAQTLRSLSLSCSTSPSYSVSEATSPLEWTSTMSRLYTTKLPLLREAAFLSWPLLAQYDESFVFLTNCRVFTLVMRAPARLDRVLDQVLATLRCCLGAEEIHLRIARGTGPGPMGQRLSLPAAKRLVIALPSSICLEVLCAPNLTSLEIDNRAPERAEGGASSSLVQPFLQTSSPRLDRFTARGFDTARLVSILEMLNTLRSLVIAHSDLSDLERTRYLLDAEPPGGSNLARLRSALSQKTEVADKCLEALVLSTSKRQLCPNLEELSYMFSPTRTNLRLLREVATSRKLSSTPLKKVTLASWQPSVKALYDPEGTDVWEQELAAEVERLVIGDWWFDREQTLWRPWMIPSTPAKPGMKEGERRSPSLANFWM